MAPLNEYEGGDFSINRESLLAICAFISTNPERGSFANFILSELEHSAIGVGEHAIAGS
jgi:hypothetical protein